MGKLSACKGDAIGTMDGPVRAHPGLGLIVFHLEWHKSALELLYQRDMHIHVVWGVHFAPRKWVDMFEHGD